MSAQQARERKKAYLGDLEVKAKDQNLQIEQMEEKINTLTNENNMLRQVTIATALLCFALFASRRRYRVIIAEVLCPSLTANPMRSHPHAPDVFTKP